MKKIISFIIAAMLIICCVGCSNNENNIDTSSTESKPVVLKPQKADGKQTLDNISLDLISITTGEFDKMYFNDFEKSNIYPSNKGTAMTIIAHTNGNYSVEQIEKMTFKDTKGKVVNMSMKVYMLNNKNACIIFAKTEGEHKASEYAIKINTYDGCDKLIPINDTVKSDAYKKFVTNAGDAKFGDLINVKDMPYFILQSGKIANNSYKKNNTEYSELTIGTVLIPLYNDYEYKLTKNDFTTLFMDNDKIGKGSVKTQFDINDEEIIKGMQANYKNLFFEVLTCTFSVEIKENVKREQTIARRDYVMNNTWFEGKFDETFLYKPYSI